MKFLVTAIAYALSLVLVAAMAFIAFMALAAEDQAFRIHSFAEFVVFAFGWLTVLVLPAYFAALVWRRIGAPTVRDTLINLRTGSAALFLSIALAVILHFYDCFVEGSGQCPTWVAHLLIYIAVLYLPAPFAVEIIKSVIAQWHTMMGG